MDIGLREWLIIIGFIVIAAILFDGWRRIRGSRSKLKLDKNLNQFYDERNDVNSIETQMSRVETPSLFAGQHNEEIASHDMVGSSAGKRKEQQISLNLEQQAQKKENTVNKPLPQVLPIEEVLVINVVASSPEGFKGPALLQNILESGLRFGEMDIFHRHESMTGNGERYFSMANGVKPGTFDLDDIDHFSTRAVSFFLGLPGPKHPKRAFDVMLAAARKLSNELAGELLDDHHSILTAQTIEHYRQRIVEFERRKLTQKR